LDFLFTGYLFSGGSVIYSSSGAVVELGPDRDFVLNDWISSTSLFRVADSYQFIGAAANENYPFVCERIGEFLQ
jgi:hypothetical protein